MKNDDDKRQLTLRLLIQAGYAVVALIGMAYGFDIGMQMAGPLIGVVMAINSALFAVLLFSVVAGWVERRRQARPPER